jgi:hypothetical protein
MRHARITYLVLHVGLSREAVKDLVGHASVKTTALYINPAADVTQKMLDQGLERLKKNGPPKKQKQGALAVEVDLYATDSEASVVEPPTKTRKKKDVGGPLMT